MTSTVLTKVSVAFIYREARFGSETISQTYLAENLQVLGEEKDWLHVRQEDGYEGWIASFFVVEKPELWDDYDFFSPASQISWVYQNPRERLDKPYLIVLLFKSASSATRASKQILKIPQ